MYIYICIYICIYMYIYVYRVPHCKCLAYSYSQACVIEELYAMLYVTALYMLQMATHRAALNHVPPDHCK